jgi:hypothetical protein
MVARGEEWAFSPDKDQRIGPHCHPERPLTIIQRAPPVMQSAYITEKQYVVIVSLSYGELPSLMQIVLPLGIQSVPPPSCRETPTRHPERPPNVILSVSEESHCPSRLLSQQAKTQQSVGAREVGRPGGVPLWSPAGKGGGYSSGKEKRIGRPVSS